MKFKAVLMALLVSCGSIPFKPYDKDLVGSWDDGAVRLVLKEDYRAEFEKGRDSWTGNWTRYERGLLTIIFRTRDGEFLDEALVITQPYTVESNELLFDGRTYRRVHE